MCSVAEVQYSHIFSAVKGGGVSAVCISFGINAVLQPGSVGMQAFVAFVRQQRCEEAVDRDRSDLCRCSKLCGCSRFCGFLQALDVMSQ